MIIDTGTDSNWMVDGWAWHLRECMTAEAVDAAELRLHKTLRRNRDNERPCDWIRDALALCAARRDEITAHAAMRPGATGQHSNNGT